MHAASALSLAAFLNAPLLSGVLLTVGLVGLLVEMQTLHGVAGAIGLAALGIFFAAHIAGGAGAWIVVLAVFGLSGILWELHVVPGHGVPGVAGGIALIASAMLAFGGSALVVGLQTVASAMLATIVVFYLATRVFPENAWMKKLTFAAAQGADYVTSGDFSALIGRSGTASSFLRPAGIAVVDGLRVDVLTHGEFIPAGTPVRVTSVEGARIFVEPVTLPSYKE
jgi:membrane-bound serine protease (ClpP class)